MATQRRWKKNKQWPFVIKWSDYRGTAEQWAAGPPKKSALDARSFAERVEAQRSNLTAYVQSIAPDLPAKTRASIVDRTLHMRASQEDDFDAQRDAIRSWIRQLAERHVRVAQAPKAKAPRHGAHPADNDQRPLEAPPAANHVDAATLLDQAERAPHQARQVARNIRTLHEALDELPADQSVAVKLVHLRGFSTNAAAEQCEVGIPTFRSRLRLAKKKLAELLPGWEVMYPAETFGELPQHTPPIKHANEHVIVDTLVREKLEPTRKLPSFSAFVAALPANERTQIRLAEADYLSSKQRPISSTKPEKGI